MRVLSLFSGIGAHDYGLEMAGLRISGQVEINPYCAAVLERHWPNVSRWTDVRDVRADDVVARCGHIDLVTGGVPCQPASVAGKRLGAADSRWLWPEYLRLVVDLQPQWILAENVPGFLSLGESGQVFADLEAAGYEVWPLVVGAWAVGAPHKRDRVWIVGRLAESKAKRCERSGIAWRRGHGPANEGAAVADAAHRGQRTDGSASGHAGHTDERGKGRLVHATGPRLEGHGIDAGQPQGREPRSPSPSMRWPARPGDPQHEWEAPRLVNAASRQCDGRTVEPRKRSERGTAPDWPAQGGSVGDSAVLREGQAREQRAGIDAAGHSGAWAVQGDESRPVEPGLGRAVDGPSPELVACIRRHRDWDDAQAVAWWHRNRVRIEGRHRRERLKALGNANPPWVPYLIGRWIMRWSS